jgi:3-phenylpropionate/trans-cinnamate dioxygenase ferredoxin component
VTEERICSIHDVDPGQAKRFDVGRLKIAVVRIDDDWYAIGDTCTHQKISLSEGEVHADIRSIECWKYGSSFSLETGEPNSLPATKAEPIYELRIDGEDVLVVLT